MRSIRPWVPGCPNRREDVLRVQHLLHIAWNDVPNSKGFRLPGETQPLKADGIFGPTTTRFIKFFQEEAVRHKANCTTDGGVDPVAIGQPAGSISGTFYAILAMGSARNNRQIAN